MGNRITSVEFKPGLSPEVEVIPIADTLRKHKAVIAQSHRAQFYNIFWIQKGTAEYFIDFEPVRVKANSFLFVSKDRVKALDLRRAHDGKILLFTGNFFAKSAEDTRYLHSTLLFNDLLNVPLIDTTAAPALQAAFRAIEEELLRENDAFHYGILHNLLHNLLLLAERARLQQGLKETAKSADLDYAVLFRDLLEAQFKSARGVGVYAAQMNVSEKRLANATAKTMGKSPKAIIDERVMLEAKRLLIHTGLSIKEIGYELGYEDPAYFIKYFRKHTGKTPIEFKAGFLNR